MSFASAILTDKGKQLAIRSMSGEELTFTKIAIGTGRITTQDPKKLTNLVSHLADGAITNFVKKERGVKITATFQNADIPNAFYWREIGLYAKTPDSGEVLYAYQNAYDTAEYITPVNMVTRNVAINITVDDSDSLTAEQRKDLVYATWEDIDNITHVVAGGRNWHQYNDGTIEAHGRLRKSGSYSNGIWTITLPKAMDVETVLCTPELYGDRSTAIPSFAVLDKFPTYCTIKASSACEGLSWSVTGRTLDDVIKYGSFSYGAGAKIGH